MSATTGVMMLRVLGVAAIAAMVGSRTTMETPDVTARAASSIDVAALLAAANGAPPVICALAAQSVRNRGWGDWSDAPATPLAPLTAARTRDDGSDALPDADVDRLVAALGASDACVREIAVRLLGSQRSNERVRAALVTRLGAADVATREVAAYGLGMVQGKTTIDPLIAALRDAAPTVRANAAWALGRMDAGQALRPVLGLFGDGDVRVREAAVVAAGHIDSGSAVDALTRVLTSDESPAVRRVAAWALGQREVRGAAASALATALGRDADARVREMAAWALGSSRDRGTGIPALSTALQRDESDAVREMAAWALGELGDRSGIEALDRAAGGDRSSRVRGTSAWAIGNLRGRGTPMPAGLLKVLHDESDDARLKAAWALGEVGDPSAVSEIRDALKREQSSQVRRALVRALVKSGGRSEENLTALLSSSDATVREAAVRGLVGSESFNPWPWPQPRPRPFP
jgi:HEAT repeat protein